VHYRVCAVGSEHPRILPWSSRIPVAASFKAVAHFFRVPAKALLQFDFFTSARHLVHFFCG